MLRAIVGWQPDAGGSTADDSATAWVAVLACGHGQHVRHVPPLSDRPWVLTAEGRARFLGYELNCVRCDAGEPSTFAVQDA